MTEVYLYRLKKILKSGLVENGVAMKSVVLYFHRYLVMLRK
jgi:sRNA-binding regulator protein Hfq